MFVFLAQFYICWQVGPLGRQSQRNVSWAITESETAKGSRTRTVSKTIGEVRRGE